MASKKKVTTKMIADYIGMSQSTVSMILSNKPYVSFSNETKEKEQEINPTTLYSYNNFDKSQ